MKRSPAPPSSRTERSWFTWSDWMCSSFWFFFCWIKKFGEMFDLPVKGSAKFCSSKNAWASKGLSNFWRRDKFVSTVEIAYCCDLSSLSLKFVNSLIYLQINQNDWKKRCNYFWKIHVIVCPKNLFRNLTNPHSFRRHKRNRRLLWCDYLRGCNRLNRELPKQRQEFREKSNHPRPNKKECLLKCVSHPKKHKLHIQVKKNLNRID